MVADIFIQPPHHKKASYGPVLVGILGVNIPFI